MANGQTHHEHWNNSTRDPAEHTHAHVPAAYCVLTSGESAMFQRRRPWIACSGGARQAVENSAPCNGPNTQFGALPMQLADHVEPKCNGQSATERPPAHPVVCSRHLASHCCLVSTSHVSPLCESAQRPPSPNSQQPSNDAEYPLPTATVLTNNSQAMPLPNAARMLPILVGNSPLWGDKKEQEKHCWLLLGGVGNAWRYEDLCRVTGRLPATMWRPIGGGLMTTTSPRGPG